MASASAPPYRFLPCLSTALNSLSDGLLPGSVGEINLFLSKLLLLVVFHHSNRNPNQDNH